MEIEGFLFGEKEEKEKSKNNFYNYKSRKIIKKVKIKSQARQLRRGDSMNQKPALHNS